MNKYIVTTKDGGRAMIVAENQHAIIVKAEELGVKLGKIQPGAILVTCGYGKDAHQWWTTRQDAKAHGAKCMQHRS